jgi:hypothetical protein
MCCMRAYRRGLGVSIGSRRVRCWKGMSWLGPGKGVRMHGGSGEMVVVLLDLV